MGLTVWIMAICGGVAHREGSEGLLECRGHPTPLSNRGADDTGARLEICVIFCGSICYDTVHIKTTGYMKKLGVSPHSFLVSQSETGHCTLASAVATTEKQSKQMPTFKKRILHHPVITWSCEPVHCFLSLSSFLFPCPPDSPGPCPCAVRVSRWQEKKERQQ